MRNNTFIDIDMLGVLDYNAGNLTSVCNTLERLNVKYFVSANPEKLEKKAEKILFPGVGHANAAMAELQKRGLDVFLQNTKKPVLGICVGMQLLFDFSEEGEILNGQAQNTTCLGIIPGSVKKFDTNEVGIVPHMGWNEVSKISIGHPLFENIPDYSDFYFVHSYYCFPENRENILAITDYKNKSFCCSVQKDNFVGVQFHPEKSADFGTKILESFCAE